MLRTYEYNTIQSECYKEIYSTNTKICKNIKVKYGKLNNRK